MNKIMINVKEICSDVIISIMAPKFHLRL